MAIDEVNVAPDRLEAGLAPFVFLTALPPRVDAEGEQDRDDDDHAFGDGFADVGRGGGRVRLGGLESRGRPLECRSRVGLVSGRGFPRGRSLVGAAAYGAVGFAASYALIYSGLVEAPASAGAVLLALTPDAAAQDFERPVDVAPTEQDIGDGYQTPEVQRPLPRAQWHEVLDVALLAAALGLAAWWWLLHLVLMLTSFMTNLPWPSVVVLAAAIVWHFFRRRPKGPAMLVVSPGARVAFPVEGRFALEMTRHSAIGGFWSCLYFDDRPGRGVLLLRDQFTESAWRRLRLAVREGA